MLTRGLRWTKLILKEYSHSLRACRAMSEAENLFESTDIADAYVKYRPTYGPDVYDTIVKFCNETESSSSSCECDLSLAVDVGCGSGQSSLPLTKRFKKVIGLDVSQAQVDRAPKQIPNLSFRVGPAEDLSFVDNGSVDLVTVGQAMHWMHVEKLYPEVERVLKPGGAFVVYGYGLATLDEPKADAILKYFHSDLLGPYWADGRQHVDNLYSGYSLPFPNWRRNDTLLIERHWTVDEFVGYLCSWSAFQNYLFANPLDNAMPSMREKLREAYQCEADLKEERQIKVTWPVFMLMGHKPQS